MRDTFESVMQKLEATTVRSEPLRRPMVEPDIATMREIQPTLDQLTELVGELE